MHCHSTVSRFGTLGRFSPIGLLRFRFRIRPLPRVPPHPHNKVNPIPFHSMILISRTFDVVTPESAEDCESAESGFLVESESVTFRELVSLMKSHPNPSCYPARGEAYESLSSYPETDYRDASERTESLHFDRENSPRLIKYWRKAMICAGIIRK